MSKNIYTAFYLSIFIAAVRKIVNRFVIHPATKNDYHVTIPFCGHCIVAGRYRARSVATRAKHTIELKSSYVCDVVPSTELYDYIRTKCGGSSSSIFDEDKTSEYLSQRKRIIIRAFVRDYESEC